MSGNSLSDLIEEVIDDVTQKGLPYTPHELYCCEKSFRSLWVATRNKAQALAVLSALLMEATREESPWEWIIPELRFEATVAIKGNRAEVALRELRSRIDLTDEELDLYNQRLRRFAKIDLLDQGSPQ